MAARDFGFRARVVVSDRFRARDTSGIWLNELEFICAQAGATLRFFGDDWQAQQHLTGCGLLFAASESNVQNHVIAHDIFRHAPPTFLKVTLQHGFECVGFRHGADHVRAHGATASFAADIVCGWYGLDHMTAMAPSQAPKVIVTGPTSVLQMATGEFVRGSRLGLVCENLHSVRFQKADKLQSEFLRTFSKFAGALHRQGGRIRLRPHPGGQFSTNSGAVLPRNVELENAPLYRLDLRQFCYGISPPSSVLIDMLLADIPTAVWQDWRGLIDTKNYDGLITVSSADQLLSFAEEAERNPAQMVMRQREWLERQGMPLEPDDVYARFAQLFEAAERMEVRLPGSRPERQRLLVVAYDSPLMQARIEEALAPLTANGEVTSRTVTHEELEEPNATVFADRLISEKASLLDAYGPSAILLCGQGVSAYKLIVEWAKRRRVPVIYIVHEAALNLWSCDPREAMDEAEIAVVSQMLQDVDVIYAPTEELKAQLEQVFPRLRTVAGPGVHQGPDQRQPLKAFRQDLAHIIALTHAA
jgi:hypothetical protein